MFKSPKQRAFYFAKKSGKPKASSNPAATPIAQVAASAPPANPAIVPQFKIPGLPKTNKFGRIKKNFKMGY